MYDAVITDMLRYLDLVTVWIEIFMHRNNRFVVMVQVYNDKTANNLTANAIIACPLQIVF